MEKRLYEELVAEAIRTLEEDDVIFTDCVETIIKYSINYTGFVPCYPMEDLEEHYRDNSAIFFIEDLNADFKIDDLWFYHDNEGIHSIKDKISFYRDNVVDIGALYGEVVECARRGTLFLEYPTEEFDELIEEIVRYNED